MGAYGGPGCLFEGPCNQTRCLYVLDIDRYYVV